MKENPCQVLSPKLNYWKRLQRKEENRQWKQKEEIVRRGGGDIRG